MKISYGGVFLETNGYVSLPQDGTISSEEATRLLKYFAVEPAIFAQGGDVHQAILSAASRKYIHPVTGKVYSFSVRTLYRYLKAYRKFKLNGLISSSYRNKGRPKSISESLKDRILLLKQELPIRSARKIIVLLELSGEVEKGVLKERTISRLLKDSGYTCKALTKSPHLYSKVITKSIYELYQSDITESWILDGAGNAVKVYLFVIIDTYSRFVVHAQFYMDSVLPRLEDCLKKAVTKYGLCMALFVDNGKIYISNHFRLSCASLGVKLIHSTVYYPQGKGVIERFNRSFKEDFMSELKLNPVKDVRILNERFFAWLETSYHREPHPSQEDKSHKEVWDNCVRDGIKPRFVSPLELTEAFYHEVSRTVSVYGVISFETNTYEVDASLIGEKVKARYDPFDLSVLYIYHKGRFVCRARLIDLSREKHSQYDTIQKDHKSDPVSGINYTELLGEQFKKMVKEQADALMQGNRQNAGGRPGDGKPTAATETVQGNERSHDPGDIRPGSEAKAPDFAITLQEFILVVSEFMGVTTLSYQQKDLLQKNYQDFRVFNPELLKGTLDNLKSQYPDSSRNLLFYLNEIRSQLNKKS